MKKIKLPLKNKVTGKKITLSKPKKPAINVRRVA